MKIANYWQDYKVIATGDGEKLENWNGINILRPDPQIIWKCEKSLEKIVKLDARYTRGEGKSGEWKFFKAFPKEHIVCWKDYNFFVQPMNFKHMGLFPEQAVNWEILENVIKSANRPLKVLNMFAYTGAMSIVCAKCGANVTHVDAAKSMVEISKQNAKLNGIDNIRYIIDDCIKFVEKEIRRNNTYDIILMDPPSFGRGPSKELWKLEDNLFDFLCLTKRLLSDKPVLVLVNSYTTGLQPTVMSNMLTKVFGAGKVESYEVCLPTEEKNIYLPCGCTAKIEF